MTFKEWRATGEMVLTSDVCHEPHRLYHGDLFINLDSTSWCLRVDSEDYYGSLPALERRLYDWAVNEGILS